MSISDAHLRACLLPIVCSLYSSEMSNKQRLVLSIIDFLNQSVQDGTVKQDDQEGLEVASTSLIASHSKHKEAETAPQSNVLVKPLASTHQTLLNVTAFL